MDPGAKWPLVVVCLAMDSLERKIREYTVIDAELASLRPGKAVYVQQASGLVFYRADPSSTHSEHRQKLEQLRKELSQVKQDAQN